MTKPTPKVLHLGDPVLYNHELYDSTFSQTFDVVRPSTPDRARDVFSKDLRDGKYGAFTAIFRPHWNTGNEMSPWNEELISLLPPSCKISASAGAGFDWVDTAAMAARGIVYCNGAGASTEAVADMCLWHVIGTFRALAWSSSAAKSGDGDVWMQAHKGVPGLASNPQGQSLGIIGLGRIGVRIAEKVRGALDMNISYFDVVRKEDEEKRLDLKFVGSMDELVGAVDCVVLATPFIGEKLVTKEFLNKFKKGGRFVNIARGKLVDEQALVDALKEGQLSAAGLDVFEDEPNVHVDLTRMKQVMLTCHNAGGSTDTAVEFERLAMQNILNWYKDGEGALLTPVNLSAVKGEKA